MEKQNRLLVIMKYLWEQTDIDHPATMKDIAAHLESEGLSATRKTISHDIDQLREAGVDIDFHDRMQNQYFIDRRVFEMPEVKLLVDAVQSARFISSAKSKTMIHKLSAFVSAHQADVLKRQLYVESRVKSPNESVLYLVDLIHSAIQDKHKITFQYFEYNQKKQKVLKHGGQIYCFSPYALVWNEDCYYALGFSDSHGGIVKFRVDRMQNIAVTEDKAVKKPADFKIADYSSKVFSMYNGKECVVTLRCENAVMKNLVDRFGSGFKVTAHDADHFDAKVSVSLSPTFYGWVFSFGGSLKIVAPKEAVAEFHAILNKFQ